MSAPALVKPAVQPPRKSRMTLDAVISGKVAKPYRVLIHGTDGVGKSTFGASAPKPIFLGTEDGTSHLDISRFPAPECWEDVLEALQALTVAPKTYDTLVVDSLDWAEPLLFQHICQADKVASIELVGGGYGKGYVAALDEWRRFLAAVERLQQQRGMHVVLIAHSSIRPFRNPEGEDFERYVLKLNDKAAGLLREWCDVVGFANYETFAVKSKDKRVRGVSTGARLLYTVRTAAYDAKNRFDLPESMPLDWETFDAAVKSARPADPAALAAECTRKAQQLGGDAGAKAAEAIAKAGANAAALARINSRLNALLAESAQEDNQ